MKHKSVVETAWIAPGIAVHVGQPKGKRFRSDSSLDAYLRATCPHSKRDPRGVCYECAQKEVQHATL